MGRINNERKVHFFYGPKFIEHWNNQSEEFRELCNKIGKENGYSGQNIFYTYLYQYWAHKISGIIRKDFKKV